MPVILNDEIGQYQLITSFAGDDIASPVLFSNLAIELADLFKDNI